MLPPPLPKQKSWLRSNWKCFSIALLGLIGLCTLLFIRFFVIQLYQTPSGSMKPTILIGDRFLINRIRFAKEIKRGDIIVFRSPLDKTKSLKRVVGMPGEKMQISNGIVIIDYHELGEKYINKINPQENHDQDVNFSPLTVPDDSFFVLGDNRNNSRDSRHYGFIPFQNIIGRVSMIVWSWDPEKDEPRWDRFLKKVE
jgi:signal peptidase I